MASANRTQVVAAFRQVYGRQPSAAELAKWANTEQGDVRTQDFNAQLKQQLATQGDPNPVQRTQSTAALERTITGGGTPTIPQYGQPTIQPTQPSYAQFSPQNLSFSPSFQAPTPSYLQNPNFQQLASTQFTQGKQPTPGIAYNPNAQGGQPTNGTPGFEGYQKPGSSPSGAQVNAPAGKPRSDGTTLDGLLNDVKAYTDELNQVARGDYDFIIKYLDRQHKMALGTNDAARAQFFESVSNQLENNIGRIPFDYMQKSDRERQNLGNIFRRNEIATKQLQTQEEQFNKQQGFKAEQDAQKLREDFSGRGMIDSGIQKKEENKAQVARQLFEQDPFSSDMAYKRAQLQQGLSEDVLGSTQRTEDITTGARRDSQDFIFGQDKAREGSKMDLEKQLAENARRGAESERSVRSSFNNAMGMSLLGG